MFGSLRILLFVEALANFYFSQTIAKGVALHYRNKSRFRQTVTYTYTSHHATTVVLQPAYQKLTNLNDRRLLGLDTATQQNYNVH